MGNRFRWRIPGAEMKLDEGMEMWEEGVRVEEMREYVLCLPKIMNKNYLNAKFYIIKFVGV